MLSKAVTFSKYTIPLVLKDTACSYFYLSSGLKRHFHERTFLHQENSKDEIETFAGETNQTSEAKSDKSTREGSSRFLTY